MLLYLIRHGDPDYPTDTLTLRGMFQAEAVGRRMADAGIDRIFSSPMGRARLTAAPAARLLASHGFIVVGCDHLGHGRTATGPESRRMACSSMFSSSAKLEGAYTRIPGTESR